MFNRRKAASVGLSATLLASLFATALAPIAFAATSVSSAGSVARGATSSGTVSITLTENTAACLTAVGVGQSPNPAVADDLRITLTDSAASAGTVDFSGTPTIVAPGSLGATAAVTGGDLVIQLTGTDTANVEQITVSGLTVTTTSAAAIGAVTATLTGPSSACFIPGTVTATGVIAIGIAAGSTSVTVNVDDCPFVATAAPAGPLSFATSPETRNISAAGALGTPGPGQQVLTIQATANNHNLGEVVSQAGVPNCNGGAIGTAATVTGRLDLAGVAGSQVFPGENNQQVTGASVTVTATGAGTTTNGLPSGAVVTFTLQPAGVQFSLPPSVTYGGAITGPATCTLSFDRTSCSVTTTAASTGPADTIAIGNIRVDVAPTVALGSAVNVAVTTSPARTVVPANVRISYVSRTVVGVGGIPTIFINVNDQNTGQLTLTEATAGFFRAGVGENNAFAICFASGEQLTRAPWAVVTSGDLTLLSGAVGAASAQGTLFTSGGMSCARWTVFGRAATPVVSTIEIRGADASNVVLPSGANNGPRVNVVPGIGAAGTPGPTLVNLYIGQQALVQTADASTLSTTVQNAVRAFRSGVNVTAVSQPVIARGAVDALAGNIRITETLAGQFKVGQTICLTILPRTSTTINQMRQDTLLKTANQNDLPIVSTNTASGLLATRTSTTSTGTCLTINQQATGTLGEITISNLRYITLADAPNGPILVQVTGNTGGGAVAFEAVVSNATIGVPTSSAATALGVTTSGPFTTTTKVTVRGRYVTYRFDMGPAAANQIVTILGAVKTGTTWSAFTPVTSRRANASGVVYYHVRHSTATWRSYRASFSGTFTPARQARWT